MDAKQRQAVRAELVSYGYSWQYVDSWAPKLTLYWHRPQLNTEGQMVKPIGTVLPMQPGNPEHAAKKARMGLLPWPPNETCQCKACRERNGTVRTGEKFMAPTEVTRIANSQGILVSCDQCDYVQTKGETQMAREAGLRLHTRKHRSQ
jgi:hypothetical protein